MIYKGACHCGKLKSSFKTRQTPQALGVRTCQCSFCRSHGATNISDGAGSVTIDGRDEGVERYQFGLRTADFLICKTCGTYIAAVIGEGPNIRSTLNVAGLLMTEFLSVEEAPMDYDEETTDIRIARRFEKWTPTQFTDPALASANFGPH